MNAEHGMIWAARATSWEGGRSGQAPDLVTWDVEDGPLDVDVDVHDWRGHRAIQLELTSPRRTGARVDLQVLDAAGDINGAITFAVDWIGDNKMQGWLHAFEPRDADERWADVHRVRLIRRDPGLWPTALQVGRIAVTDRIDGWEVNDSDAVVDMAWREITAHIDAWQPVEERIDLPEESTLNRRWDDFGYIFGFRQGVTPGRIALERQFDLDISQYREILAKLTWDHECSLTVTALVDGGREIHLHDGRPFGDSYCTLAADLDGARHLDHIRIELAEPGDRTLEHREIGMDLLWILLRRPTPQDEAPVETVKVRLANTHSPYPLQVETTERQVQQISRFEDGPMPSLDPGDPVADGLPFGFYITKDNLHELRRAVCRAPANLVFDQLIAEADRAIATELVDRNYYGDEFGGGIGLPKGLRGSGMRVFAPTVAAAHLLTGERRYADAARRWILRTARSDDWRGDHGGCVDRPHAGEVLAYWDSFTGWYPLGFSGHMNHHFWISDVAFGTVVAYEMLYHCFSVAEREEMETAFADHGVYVLYDRLRYERERYLNTNQGVLMAVPLLMQAAFLRRRSPVFEDVYRWTVEFLIEYGRRPWNEEGVCTEGPGYGLGTVGHCVESLFPLAACLDKTVQDVVTAGMLEVSTWAQHCRSAWPGDGPRFVGLGDLSYSSWIPARTAAFWATYGHDAVARYFWEESHSDRPLGNIESLLILAQFAKAPSPEAPDLPPAKVFKGQPMAFLRTGWCPGDTLLVLTNMQHQAGHEHFDRGSLIFEFNGESLLVDPGMGFYGSPDAPQFRSTCCHNTLTFSQRNQLATRTRHETAIDGFLTTSGEHCPGDDGGIDWVVADVAAVYPEAEEYRRHVIFIRPDICVLCDEVRAKEPEPVELNFTCLGELSRSGPEQFVSTTAKNRLLIHSQSKDELDWRMSEFKTSLPDTPAYRLIASRSTPRQTCTFLTALAAHPLAGEAPVVESLALDDGLGLRIRRQGEEVLVLMRHKAESSVALEGVTTDARIAVARRAVGVVNGAAMLAGTHLAVEGTGRLLSTAQSAFLGGVRVGETWTEVESEA